MARSETTVERNATVSTLPPVFVPTDQFPKTLPSGFALTCSSEAISLTELTCEGRTFVFNYPLHVQVVQEDGEYSFESEEYSLTGYGDTRTEAESSFNHVFLYVWDRIACEDDEKLTLDAIELKRALLALVKAKK